jgi:chemotaxis protein methyltransferase CheR
MAMISAETGIQLPAAKRAMVSGRLAKRMRQLDCDHDTYAARVRKDAAEFVIAVDLVVTNHTSWWREGAHFDDFRARVVESALTARTPRLRVWCAACSTGEEAWSIAACIQDGLRHHPVPADAALLATDISTRALTKARAGIYPAEALRNVPPGLRELACEKSRAAPSAPAANPFAAPTPVPDPWRVRPPLRALVQFARLNLMGDWPMRGPFDAVFCRNVMIYFDTATQRRLVKRLVGLLRPGGTLYVGLSESLAGCGLDLRAVQPSVYVLP